MTTHDHWAEQGPSFFSHDDLKVAAQQTGSLFSRNYGEPRTVYDWTMAEKRNYLRSHIPYCAALYGGDVEVEREFRSAVQSEYFFAKSDEERAAVIKYGYSLRQGLVPSDPVIKPAADSAPPISSKLKSTQPQATAPTESTKTPGPQPAQAPGQPEPWPTLEPTNFDECIERLQAAKNRIRKYGYKPKFSDEQLAQQVAHASGPVQDRFLVNFRNGNFAPNETLGTPSVNNKVRYWSTTLDQIEDGDTDPMLIAAKLGIPPKDINPSKGFSLAIIYSHHPDLAEGKTIVPSYSNIGTLVKQEVDGDLNGDIVDIVMSPEYEGRYRSLDAGYSGFCENAGIKPWDPEAPDAFADNLGLSGSERERYVTRRIINNKFGANSEFTGDGTTKHMPTRGCANSKGCMETLTLQRNPPIVTKSPAIRVISL